MRLLPAVGQLGSGFSSGVGREETRVPLYLCGVSAGSVAKQRRCKEENALAEGESTKKTLNPSPSLHKTFDRRLLRTRKHLLQS